MANKISNPKITGPTAIAAAGGTLVLIAATKNAKYVEIQECAPSTFDNAATPYAPQGLIYTLPDDGFVVKHALLPGAILSFGDNTFKRDRAIGVGPMTDPAGNAILGTPYCKLVSATATTTQTEQREWS